MAFYHSESQRSDMPSSDERLEIKETDVLNALANGSEVQILINERFSYFSLTTIFIGKYLDLNVKLL